MSQALDIENGNGSSKNALSAFKIVAVQEQVKADQVHLVGLGKGQGLTDETTQALPEGVVETLDVIGQACFLANRLMQFIRYDGLIRVPEVGEANTSVRG